MVDEKTHQEKIKQEILKNLEFLNTAGLIILHDLSKTLKINQGSGSNFSIEQLGTDRRTPLPPEI